MEPDDVSNLVGEIFLLSDTKVIDLKKDEKFLVQYVNLRNTYKELLLTPTVTIDETRKWLRNDNIEIWGLIENTILLGVIILYLDRNGEIAFFVKDQNKGTGSHLLSIIENIACKKNLHYIWAWVLSDNIPAYRAFEKNGFTKVKIVDREYNGIIRHGVEFKKKLESIMEA